MAFAVGKISHVASKAKARRPFDRRGFLSTPALVGIGAAAGVWVTVAFAVIHSMGSSLPPAKDARFSASLGLNGIMREAPKEQRLVRLPKFSRITVMPRINLAARGLPHKAAVAVAAARPAAEFIEKTQVAALAQAAASRSEGVITGSVPVVANALVEEVSLAEQGVAKPFGLVMTEASALNGTLPDLGPLPLTKPRSLAGVTDMPSERKPLKQLAYAKPGMVMDDEDTVRPVVRGRKGVAYYDISAGVVHMPNGERLEAHSGIGKMRDNPDFTHVKMKGPTPPGTYKVTMRESLFHGVEAVRLTPTNGVAPLGRTGLLAHSYLLRKPGDSHGCVAFANYPKFLKAFKRGEITHMVIVESMKGGFSPAKKTLASLFSRKG
ncbi:DUF2778 domain-containing protein [Pararhizobium gei]|uniref:DUF2778 domain-containing protein n=1 Tax=Pararhizobium gei TaxID=1395951 RepID=UPI0023DC3009|nr:DUF2778 domain-containing protein [Rhizobium gei]